MGIGEPLAGNPIFGKGATPRVAKPAGLNLLAQHGRHHAALCISLNLIDGPSGIAPFAEANSKALGGVLLSAKGPPALLLAGPGHMRRTLPVAGLATHTDLSECGGEAIARRVIILVHAGRVTFGAHAIPILVELSPMQDIIVADVFVGIKMEPALPALIFRTAVPGNRQSLQTAVWKFNQILLQGIDAEGVFDLEDT